MYALTPGCQTVLALPSNEPANLAALTITGKACVWGNAAELWLLKYA